VQPPAGQNGPIAIQGERGSYSEEAAHDLLGPNLSCRCCRTFEEVFQLTKAGKVPHCLVPLENSLAGSIYKNYDLLSRYRLRILRETNLLIHHNLIAVPGVTFAEIRAVLSHPVALDQCEKFFARHPHLERRTAYDTSGSVKEILESNWRDCAAIAGRGAAEFYGGQILMSGIEDNEENFTRFVLLGTEMEVSDQANKTSIVFSFRNAPGALFKCLSVFALRDIDLTKIESRPIPGRPWEYLFYIDFLGNIKETRVKRALSHLEEITEFLELLGCYPAASAALAKGM
jgi:prephenate dehydratase